MRSLGVVAVLAVLLVALVVGLIPSRAPAPPAPPPVSTARDSGADFAAAETAAPRRHEQPGGDAVATPEAGGGAGVAEAGILLRARQASGLRLLVLELGTRRPLPEVGVRARLYVPRGRQRTIDLAVQSDGSAWLSADVLRGFDRVHFAFEDPEYRYLPAFEPERTIPELLAAGGILEVPVPRGPWRAFRVVTAEGVPLAGATLGNHMLRPARTGADGVGRVRLPEPPPRSVRVWAPGRRVESARVPPAGEPWEIVLDRANRLEFVLTGARDPRGYHVELDLSAEMQQRMFHQSKYVQTPGKPVEGTRGRWSSKTRRGASHWSLGFDAAGLAVVDHLYDAGTVEAALWRFGERLATRRLELTAAGRIVRTEFFVIGDEPEVSGRVVDRAGRPVHEVLVRMAPLGGRATLDQPGRRAFPVWAPSTETSTNGGFRLPRPAGIGTVLVFSKRGFAHRALTVAEVEATAGPVELETGRTVVVEVRGRGGEVLDGGWSSGDAYLHVRPRVHLGHDVWRDVSPRDHPAIAGEDRGPPWFPFADLPSGVVTFGFTYLGSDELLHHDTRFRTASYRTDASLSELRIGK